MDFKYVIVRFQEERYVMRFVIFLLMVGSMPIYEMTVGQSKRLDHYFMAACNFQGPQDCQQIYERGLTSSGIYTISLNGFIKMDVYCEQELDGGGWTVHSEFSLFFSFYPYFKIHQSSCGGQWQVHHTSFDLTSAYILK